MGQEPRVFVFLNGASSSGKSTIGKEMVSLGKGGWVHVDEDCLRGTGISFHDKVKELLVDGQNVVGDSVDYPHYPHFRRCIELFADHSVCFVKVFCPFDELLQRERARGDRDLGIARSQFGHVHKLNVYDLELDTSQENPKACALKILAHVEQTRQFKAFAEIGQIFSTQIAAIHEVITRYYDALRDQDVETASDCLGITVTSAERGRPHDPGMWRAGQYQTREAAREDLQAKFTQGYRLDTHFEFTVTDIWEDDALTIITESGSQIAPSELSEDASWQNSHTLLLLNRQEGTWKIVSIVRNIEV